MKTNNDRPERVQLSDAEAKGLKEEIMNSNLSDKSKHIVSGVIDFSIWLQNSLQRASLTIKSLKSLFGFKSEKKTLL